MAEESVEKWIGLSQIWEPVIPGVEGTLVITEYKPASEKIICKQLMNPGKVDEHLDETYYEFDKESFIISFKPTQKQYIGSLGITTKDIVTPAGIVTPVQDTHFDMVDTVLDALNTMDDSSTNYIKMDGEEDHFKGGATRYTKTGKGRYDLIPNDIIVEMIGYSNTMFHDRSIICISKGDIMEDAYDGEPNERFKKTIFNLVIHHFAPGDIVQNDIGLPAVEATIISYMDGFAAMMKELAIHYENGAEKYGVDNWKRGIPVTGGDRGGSFMDSAMRHLDQYLLGLTDEPHYISCIWNCVCGLWTLKNMKNDDNTENPVRKFTWNK